ncbi:MAG: FAD-binding oxidoreductase [Hyphomicrobiales bacterium]
MTLTTQGAPRRSPSPLDALNYYQATAHPYAPFLALEGDLSVDAIVIGAGFTGLSAALELRAKGMTVAVLEAQTIGWGATGRNGGQICTGYSPGMEKFEKALGRADAQVCFDIAEEAKALLVSRIQRFAIDCDLTWGYLVAAARPGQLKGLEEEQAQLRSYGYDKTSILTKAEFEQRVGSKIYHGALADRGAGHFHPLNYAIGLAEAARKAGAQIFEHTPALAVEDGAPAKVRTPRGTVTAKAVIVACNAYLGRLLPEAASKIMPVASYVVATEQMDAARAATIMRTRDAVADANFVVDYFRMTVDNRLLFGGRCSYSGIDPKDLAANMRPRILKVFPQLGDVKIDYAWGGYIAITHNRLPDARRIGKAIYYTQGYSGQGVVLSNIFGKMMAEAVAGEASRFDIFSKIRHAPFPGGAMLRRPALTLGMLYYRVRDLVS